ncbi:hypothetical protein [Clostridium sp. BJN0013]|uniref:hypothetical protein n=1 Tax=Clostridium sp. BJN0013 TaxID=3236840 RepID=UPI0034C6305C
MEFKGLWDIYEIKTINGNYAHMEVQSFIKINDNGKGQLQLGLTTGDLTGEIVEQGSGKKFIFRWLGMDKLKIVNGSGWIEIVKEDFIEGEVTFYNGQKWRISAKKNKFI